MTYFIKQHDLLPILQFQLVDPSGVPADLTGASLTFSMASADMVPIISEKPAIITDAATGMGVYVWEAGDTDLAGLHRGEVTATYAGLMVTYPNNGYFHIRMLPDLA